ncbi:TPA: hypothetical protein ACGVVC_002605 [Enterococcus faecium]|uniref:Uncharacterized protein n=1 Tax=Enterococcus faecium EnGen0180 TaxID=1157475 RepID=A0A829F2N4_ENTFC|nr:hypothetical protein [Enterococcus faecium]EOG24076.1 hypothetical protein SMG_02174 [Enterococcus faecium EnGen0180]MCV3197086.1 hypothetical protein [Enterococcus faecium]MDT0255640.1 hypothetical protein [Enterococcus faecium]MDT2352615.1 hypothetical protein [Enterococcus faecium]HAQ5379746.1 hypothetical protein [Enterococcus faecium]
MNEEMSQAIKVQKMIDDLTHGIDSQADKIIKELQGQKVKDAKMLLKTIKFEMNPTKRKLADVLEEKLASAINEQELLFETDTFNS